MKPIHLLITIVFERKQRTAPATKRVTKTELCADWVVQYLKANGKVDFTELCIIAQAAGYNRAMLYRTRETLKDVLSVSGTGRRVAWELMLPL